MINLYIIFIIIILVFIYIFCTYNNFIKLSNQVKEAFSTMDVYLKKRWDLIPNIVEVVKSYANYEKDIFREITELRNNVYNKMSNYEKVNANTKLSSNLYKLLSIVENYPELKANENFMYLSNQLSQIEEDIANSRKYYNGAVRLYNNKVHMFPSNIIALIFGYKEEKMFEISDNEKSNVKIEES